MDSRQGPFFEWQFTYHRVKDSKFFWATLCVFTGLAVALALVCATGDDGFGGVKIPLTVFCVLSAITLFSYCVAAHCNGTVKQYRYTLTNGVVSYTVPPHPPTRKQVGNSEYLRQYYKAKSYGAGERDSCDLAQVTAVSPRRRARRIVLHTAKRRFTVRVNGGEFDAVLGAIEAARQNRRPFPGP